LPSEQKFMGDDDVEYSVDDLKAAVTRGEFLPTTFSDYSYNALEGKYNTESAARRLVAAPLVPSINEEHSSETGESSNISSVAAGNTSVSSVEQVELSDGSIDYGLQLSTHFKLGDLSKNAVFGHRIREQHGLKVEDIINNLKVLAVNVLDPIKTKYPNMFITSGFRPASGTSQHERGQAADMQFSGVTKAEYYDIALWVRENVPHDQFILEYQSGGSGNPWLHISVKDSSNRLQILTFYNHRRYGDAGKFYQLYA
jgi:zinc D-Ala-D-Ala carboxypeptidase